MQTAGKIGKVASGLDVVEQVHAEIVQAKVGDGDPRLKVFHVDDFFLKFPKLLLAIGHVVGFGCERVVVTCCGHVGDYHPILDAFLQADIFIERDIGPVVHKLDGGIDGADTVDATESLDDADRVPVDVVIDEVVAVLEVLSFGNAIGGNENVNVAWLIWDGESLLLRTGRKKRKHGLEVVPLLQCRSRRRGAGNDAGVNLMVAE